MSKLQSSFLKSESGSFLPIFAISLVPLLLTLGLSVDYSLATSTRSSMQNALDAATLSIVTLPKTATDTDRQKALQAAFLANGGQGTVKINSFTLAADGTVDVKAAANYAMPTNFMQVAMVKDVPIAVQASVNKTPSLVEATFKIDKVSGYWGKTMTLYGTKFTESTPKKLMEINYTYNGSGGSKGYGTTTVSKLSEAGDATMLQKQECISATYKKNDKIPAGSFADGDKWVTCTMKLDNGGAVIDVSMMNMLYLQMEVPSFNGSPLKTNNAATSNFLYLDGVQVQKGKIVDIFTAVPCGQTSKQAWEDGGNNPPLKDIANADFFYAVTGKCNFSERPSGTVLTQ